MRTNFARLLTACFVIGPSVFTIILGAQMVMFVGARWAVEGQSSESASQLERWYSVNGLAFASRNVAIKSQFNLNLLRNLFTEMVSQSPLSAVTWNALAGLNLISGTPMERAVQALTMSAITAPNELHLMATRAKIGIAIWEALPPERRIGIALDLVAADRWGYFNDDKADVLAILKGKSEVVREEIRSQLLKVDNSSATVVTILGLPKSGVSPQAK